MLTIYPPAKGVKRPLCFRGRDGEPLLPAYLQLDLRGRRVTFGYWHWHSEPLDVTLGYDLWFRIDPYTSRRAAIALAKELEPLLVRMCDGYFEGWDDRETFGCLNADGTAARTAVKGHLQALLEAR